jgi:hypothetical protein
MMVALTDKTPPADLAEEFHQARKKLGDIDFSYARLATLGIGARDIFDRFSTKCDNARRLDRHQRAAGLWSHRERL